MNLQQTLRRTVGASAIAAAMMLVSTNASALCFFSSQTPTSTVTAEGPGSYAYAYTVSGEQGSCPLFYGSAPYVVNAFEVPYFTDAGITDIHAPTGWSYSIDATDTFGLGSGAETLVWTAAAGYGVQPITSTLPAGSLSGFGYTSSYGSVYAPGALVVGSFPLDIVDPALPGSPEALAAGLLPTSFPSASAVPEPSVLLTMLAGLGMVAIARRRRA